MPGLLDTPTWQDIAIRYMQQSEGNPDLAWGLAMRDRQSSNDKTLAAAEHFLYAQAQAAGGSARDALVFGLLAPGYQLAKAVGRPLGFFKGSTPPSYGQLEAGLSGALTGLLGTD